LSSPFLGYRIWPSARCFFGFDFADLSALGSSSFACCPDNWFDYSIGKELVKLKYFVLVFKKLI
jgi:hypothetical protein